ncbi:hypothetical protein EYF80_062832 [Liparis tanakae]|uniref:ZP domain-containing protein n=1 Tax=Liparis tanakae TaxID=230148 RepID=A0A4Z2EE39_9TELE|nr:hypothetical protein EYF80_062832 [Liparis tanakae]
MNALLCVRRLTSVSLMEFDSSLGLTMTLHADESFSSSYSGAVTMETEDTLFFQVTLQTNASFASDVLLRVESCWSTESSDPQDAVRGLLLRDGWVWAGPRRSVVNGSVALWSGLVSPLHVTGRPLVPSCAVDDTFRWLSANGRARTSRFSIRMFSMPTGLPLYVHCRADVCGRDEGCAESCSGRRRRKRSVSRAGKRAAVVSAGPLLVLNRGAATRGPPPDWAVVPTVAGLIGFLGAAVLSLSVTKAAVTYCERRQLQ